MPWPKLPIREQLQPLSPTVLFDDAALGGLDELNKHGYVIPGIGLGLQFLQSLAGVELGGQQDFVGVVDFANAVRREAAALQTYGIDAVGVRVAGGRGFRKWKNIAG